ncbi:RhoGEF domain containing protein [Acanthamoeba castellanii str. Neff]|uniref:RhoGEF domain containing protein n=1 Tax=Acanthamoeba castellanii (strain ATCC 30010 / Neff) TaxID=1257118 RepID=L8GIN2_ACACF|nr:RhoGEF domain containing protein [Acanthamoeba castellanii str. Neff]ELR12945.1 RhoGEF domain containing protein [Acanthamoeba castellanii str. Neff]
MFNREVELNEAAEQRSAAAAGTTKKGGGKVSSLLLATTPASRNTVKAKADKDQPATKLKSSTKRMAKSERNVKHALTEWRRDVTTTTAADKKQTDVVANTPALEELPAAKIADISAGLKAQGTGAQAEAQPDAEPAPAAAVASLQLTESTERHRSRVKSADADKRTERLLMSKNHQVLKKHASGDKCWTSAVLKTDSPPPLPRASDSAPGDSPQTGKNESESENERENEDKSENEGGSGDGGEKEESEEAKRKRCEVFMHFQRQVSITNMALFAQKERQKMALMVERERERDQLRRSAEKRQPQPQPPLEPQPQPPTESTNVDAAAKAELRPGTEDEQKEDEEEKQEKVEKVEVEVEDVEMEVEEKHRARVRNELIETEISYIHNLQILDAVLQAAKEAQVVRGAVLNIRELSTLLTLHQTFLSELQEADNSFTESFLSFIPFMKIYTAYFNAYSQVSTNLAKLHSNSAFISLLKECEERLNKESGSSVILDLDSLLILPIQRIPRYELLLSDYLKHSQRKPEELPRIDKLLTSIKELNRFLNQARRQEEAVKQLSEIQQALVFPKGKEAFSLFGRQPVRRLIHQGELRIKGDDGAIVITPEDMLPSAEPTLDDTDSDHSPPTSPSSSSSSSSSSSLASSAATTDSLPKLARRSTSQLVRQRSFDANKHRSRIVPLSSTPPAATWSSMSSLPALAPDADSSPSTVDTPMAAAAALATVKPQKSKRGGSWLELGSSAGSGGLQSTSPRQLLPTLKMAGRGGSRGSSSSSSSSSSRSYKKRYVFLFDDLLLETEPEKDAKFRFVRVHHLSECYIASTYHNEADERDVIAWVSVSAGERYLLKTKSPQDKVAWMEALLKCMKQN